ncbi:nuclear pore glycoprotein p62 [Columba livia]|nr:nuclear pore glycoprotein p62 [Columba livia]
MSQFNFGANTPKLTFGGSTATPATGVTGGFGFGSSAPSSVPSSQAAAPSGFVFGSAGSTSSTTAQSGTTGGFTFSSGTTTQAGTTGFNIGTAAPQAAPSGLTFGTAAAAAATTAATSGAVTQSTTPFSLGGQSAGLNFGSLTSTAATSAPTATLTASTSQGPTLSFGTKLGAPLYRVYAFSACSNNHGCYNCRYHHNLHPWFDGAYVVCICSEFFSTNVIYHHRPLTWCPFHWDSQSWNAWVWIKSSWNNSCYHNQHCHEHHFCFWLCFESEAIKYNRCHCSGDFYSCRNRNTSQITSLHREVEKVKLDQKRLDQELDFILSQQKELEDLLTPLEESVKEQSGTIYLQHADEERERTYKLAENIDAQLKRMAQDLKDITEHLNTSRGPADTSDPLQQICKILNAHMDSLQWIDQNSGEPNPGKTEQDALMCRANTPKLTFGGSTATPATGVTGGFGFGSSAPSSVPSSQAAAPSGFVFGSAGSTSSTTAQSGTTGGFTFSSGTTTQAGTTGFNIGTAAPQAAPSGLTFGTAAAAAATTAATSGAVTQSTTPFSLGGQSAGLNFGSLTSTAATSAPTATLTASTSQGPTLSFGTKLGAPLYRVYAFSACSNNHGCYNCRYHHNLHPWFDGAYVVCICSEFFSTNVIYHHRPLTHHFCFWLCFESEAVKYNRCHCSGDFYSCRNRNTSQITSLHREVEKVKLDQKRLDQELDFILSQQKELEDLLTPLEESVKEQSGTIYLQHADEERERTYKLAENIDAQLKHMAQDLKDIIEHLNTSGGPADTSDPLQQICKILNAHMDSLQWIDQNSGEPNLAMLQRKVEEVTKVCESRRKEQERSFRITFD